MRMKEKISPVEVAAEMYGCEVEDLLSYREYEDGAVVIIAPTGQKFRYSDEEIMGWMVRREVEETKEGKVTKEPEEPEEPEEPKEPTEPKEPKEPEEVAEVAEGAETGGDGGVEKGKPAARKRSRKAGS